MATDEQVVWGVNGFTLPGKRSLPYFTTDVSTWRGQGLSTVRNSLSIPGKHGTLEYGLPTAAEQKVTIAARFSYPTLLELNTAVARWSGMLMQPPPLTLSRTVGSFSTSAVVRLDSISNGNPSVINERWTALVTAIFGVPGAFFRQPAAASAALTFSGTLSLVEVASLSGSTQPIPDPIVRITGPATAVAVTDPRSATGLGWSGALTSAQYLFLDADKLTARISGTATDWSSGGTDATIGLTYPSSGPLQLCPIIEGLGDSDVKVRINASGSGLSAATKLTIYAGKSFDA